MANWAWFHRFSSPKWFLDHTGIWIHFVGFLALVIIAVGSIWGLFYAPMDYQQKDAFRIIYIHVPVSILAQSAYVGMASAYIVGWIWGISIANITAKALITIGITVTIISLLTGSLWGKPVWGTYWIWDARLTSMFLLFILYIGIYLMQSSFKNEGMAIKMSAILAVVGLVNIPIIKYSVEWWSTLHQPATFIIGKKSAMPASMWMPLLINIVGFYLLFFYIVVLKIRTGILEKNIKYFAMKGIRI
jgi:heme exporter protein C